MKPLSSTIATAVAVSSLTLAFNAIGAPTSNLPEAHTQGNISYLMGGVGKPEAAAIKHAAKNYPLELEFLLKAKPKDEYLSDVQIKMKDAHEKMVLDVTASGPFLLAKLPTGKYSIEAEHGGKVERREISIASNAHRRVVFEWKS